MTQFDSPVDDETVVTRDQKAASRLDWVLLCYRLPREPSTPRIAVWRRLRRLGVAQLGDGLVALPQDARTREHLEWVAAQVEEAGGAATLWRAQTLSRADEQQVAAAIAAARAEEYRQVIERAGAGHEAEASARRRLLRRLRRELRLVHRRDFFPPVERDRATVAVEELAASCRIDTDTVSTGSS